MLSTRIEPNRLYGDLAWLWPLVSPPDDYAEEARHWMAVLDRHLGPGRHGLLELGVGGGHNLSHFADGFDVTAVDRSEGMLEHSRRLNPSVDHHVGDMRTFRLGRTFDAVLVHDAISYMLSEAELRAVFDTAAAHLRRGGIFITAPDHFRETFAGPAPECRVTADGDTELAYFDYAHDPDPADTTIETIMIYTIRRGAEVRIEHDRHVTGLFPKATWTRLLESAGFAVEQQSFSLDAQTQPVTLLVGTLR